MTNVKAGEQIFMFYGKRTNAEYFIHNGFVPNEPNPHDNYLLRLGKQRLNSMVQFSFDWIHVALPKSDSAFDIKKQLLQRYGLEPYVVMIRKENRFRHVFCFQFWTIFTLGGRWSFESIYIYFYQNFPDEWRYIKKQSPTSRNFKLNRCFILDEVSTVYAKNINIDQFFDDFKIDQDSDIRSFLKTRLQLLLRPLNSSLLNSNDSIDRLLISEHDIIRKVLEKLDL